MEQLSQESNTSTSSVDSIPFTNSPPLPTFIIDIEPSNELLEWTDDSKFEPAKGRQKSKARMNATAGKKTARNRSVSRGKNETAKVAIRGRSITRATSRGRKVSTPRARSRQNGSKMTIRARSRS